jgi:translation initiation factor IF-3
MDRIIQSVTDVAAPESLPRMEGRNMSVLLTPR